jgi:copper(I)-binding protein
MSMSAPRSPLFMLLLACAPAMAAPISAPPTLQAEDAWIRWLPAGLPAAGYLTLTDSGDSPAVLVGVTSSAFARISLHRSVDAGGMMSMEPVSKITIRPHSSLSFTLAHYHLMLMDPTSAVKPGAHVPMMLEFADGSVLKVDFEVRPADSGG